MTSPAKEITRVSIEQEMKQSYLDYAMSVIVGRALPDARDGLKPVHRRVLYAMQQLSNDWNKPYKKSARIVGDVIGKYHPHGDTAVYDTIVRMAQPFSLRYLLVDGQGNFGSVDGDSPAAMRYTEIRMSRLAHEMLADLEKETVDTVPNYDESEQVPVVLPARFPNLLVNGSSGIAVGMATNIPPHNLNETIDACLALIDNGEITIEELMQYMPGPDFPTAGIIYGRAGILEGYRTGRGRVLLRGKTRFETNENSGKQAIIIYELPYQVNKAKLLEKVGELVKDKKIEGITAIRDESDREGMRVVIEVKRGENADVLLNNLYIQTQLQVTFGINMVALDHGQPRIMNLKELLQAFVAHRREVITRRTIFDLRKARERAHVLEGLAVALANLDHLIELIKSSSNPQEAKEKLLAEKWLPGLVVNLLQDSESKISRPEDLSASYGLIEQAHYRLSPAQCQAILDLRLHRLTGLEQDKIISEFKDILVLIHALLEILRNPDRLTEIMKEELVEIKESYGDVRRSEIVEGEEGMTPEDLIPDETVVVTLSHEGYAKTQLLADYQAQRRGGKGKFATTMKEEDFIKHLVVANTHDTLLCFSNRGKVYWLKTYLLPQATRLSRGRPLVNLLPLVEGEQITALLCLREFSADHYVVMSTTTGIIKKVSLPSFSRPRADGIIALSLEDNDHLVGVDITDGQSEILLFSDAGKVVRFHESQLRATGRKSYGVRGIRLASNQSVIAMIIAKGAGTILTATANGYGKRTSIEEYRQTSRGTQGVISIRVNERNGKVIGALEVLDSDDIMMISDQGKLVRTAVEGISTVGRSAQGVKLINLTEGEKLVQIQRVAEVAEVAMPVDDSL